MSLAKDFLVILCKKLEIYGLTELDDFKGDSDFLMATWTNELDYQTEIDEMFTISIEENIIVVRLSDFVLTCKNKAGAINGKRYDVRPIIIFDVSISDPNCIEKFEKFFYNYKVKPNGS